MLPSLGFSARLITLFLSVSALSGVFFCAPAAGDRPAAGLSDSFHERPVPEKPETPATEISTIYDCVIVNSYPHDPGAFTQGLIFLEGFFYESTGRYGRSTLRKVEPKTGKVLRSRSLSNDIFAEGLTVWKNRLIQITWKSGRAFVYSLDDFSPIGEFRYEGEGWGITTDGTSLVMSDGGSELTFRDPETFRRISSIRVIDRGAPVLGLNELEYVRGEIYANIWGGAEVARICPKTGAVLGWIDLSKLRDEIEPARNIDVLNGIAYDPVGDRLFVTGKLWPKVFEVKIVEGRRTPGIP